MSMFARWLKRLLWVASLLVAPLILVLPLPARADGPWQRISAPDTLDPDRSLFSNDVRALAYEADPIAIPQLWVGTDRGLQTYDGHAWQDWTVPAEGVANRDVTALLLWEGNLWVGTGSSLNVRSARGEWHSLDFDALDVLALAPDRAGGVFAGTTGGLWRCAAEGEDGIVCEETVPDLGPVQALWSGDEIWVGTTQGLLRGLEKPLAPYTTIDGLIDDRITALAVDSQSRLWIGTKGGITRFQEGGREVWKSFPDVGPVHSLAIDHGDGVWAATDRGLLYWDARWENRQNPPGEWRSYPVSVTDGVTDPVSLVYVQPGGLLWAVTGSGMNGLDTSWRAYDGRDIVPEPDRLPDRFAALLRDEASGELWAGSDVGISHYDPFTDLWDRMWTASDGMQGSVYSLVRDRATGQVWAGTESGVFEYDPESDRWTRLGSASDDLGVEAVWDLVRDSSRDTLWAATALGLLEYDAQTARWQRIWPDRDGRDLGVVYRLAHDPMAGRLWLGTNMGVVRYSVETRRADGIFWPVADLPGEDPITALTRDPETNAMWVAMENRVFYYDGGGWTDDVSPAPASVSALIYVPDANEGWAGTAAGLYRYDLDTGRWYEVLEGIDPIRGSEVGALVRDSRSGEVWLGGEGRIVRLSTSAARSLLWARVTGALSDQKDVLHADGTIKLLDTRTVGLWFEGGSFLEQGAELEYGYRLADDTRSIEPTQVQLDSSLAVTYTVPYGDYTFELWAMDARGRRSASTIYPVKVQARPVVTLTRVLGAEIVAGESISLAARPMMTIPLSVEWQDPDADRPPVIQAGWFDLPIEAEQTVQVGDTLSQIAKAFDLSYQQVAQYNGIADPDVIVPGQVVRIPLSNVPAILCPSGEIATNCWFTLTLASQAEGGGEGEVRALNASGSYKLLVRAIDEQGNESLPRPPIHFEVRVISSGGWFGWVSLLVAVIAVAVAVYTLRAYPDYASSWGAAHGHPVQQLIPLVMPVREPFDIEHVQETLRLRHAYTTSEQVEVALTGLVEQGMLRQTVMDSYVFAHPLVAWLHRLRTLDRRDTLAEAVRGRHPLYAGARAFFVQAGFDVQDLGPEAFLLSPLAASHPQAQYGDIYVRLFAGRALEGDDFELVSERARAHYDGQLRHRLAFVVINRRPTPGARYRVYEIRQSLGLAIVTLDSELFGQVKPNMPASDILTAQIDQATGRQNLYAISGPVSDDLGFFGRETVLQRLIDLIDAGQPVGIFGLRKTGKTSLLQRLQGQLATRRVIASLDVQGTAQEQGVQPLYPAIIAAFVAHIEQYRPGLTRSRPSLYLWPSTHRRTLSTDAVRFFGEDLDAIQRWIGGDERLLLIVDEVDRLLPSNSDPGYAGISTLFGQLRAANQGRKVLDLIVAGVDPAINRRDRLRDRENEFYQALHELWMPAMDGESSCEMVESIGFQMGLQYQRRALVRIVEAGGGQPFVTRQICSQIVRDLLDGGTATVQNEQARLGIEDYVYAADSYVAELWRVRLDNDQRELLIRLARAQRPVPRAELLPADRRQETLTALKSMEEWTVIRPRDQGYVIGWGVLRDWIRWIELGLDA